MVDAADNSNPRKINNASGESTNTDTNIFDENGAEVSLDDLDKLLKEEDPDFAKKLEDIGDELTQAGDHLDALDRAEFAETGPFWIRFYKKLVRKIRFFVNSWVDRIWSFGLWLKSDGRKKFVAFVKTTVKQTGERKNQLADWLESLTFLQKMSLAGIAALIILTTIVVLLAKQNKLVPQETELFFPSLELVAEHTWQVDPNHPRESFYNSLRLGQNIVLLDKVVVNLKWSPLSRHPMGVFEMLAEGSNQEVVVEIKDRNKEVRDLVQRVLEGFTYEQIDSPEGREEMRLKLRQELSTILTTGEVKKILLKNFIIKP